MIWCSGMSGQGGRGGGCRPCAAVGSGGGGQHGSGELGLLRWRLKGLHRLSLAGQEREAAP